MQSYSCVFWEKVRRIYKRFGRNNRGTKKNLSAAVNKEWQALSFTKRDSKFYNVFMKTMKRIFVFGICAFILGLIPGCRADDFEAEPIGTVTGTARGVAIGYSGSIDVYITMEDGFIVDVVIRGGMEARSSFGNTAMTRAPDMIKRRNSAQIDNISGATITTLAIKQAAQSAIDQIVAAELRAQREQYMDMEEF